MHIGVFILLLLSGERNFGVRLNKPYSVRVPMDIPVFTGTHADFLIIVSIYMWQGSTKSVLNHASVYELELEKPNMQTLEMKKLAFFRYPLLLR